MALHTLCNALNNRGRRAYIWPFNIPIPDAPVSNWWRLDNYLWKRKPLQVEGFHSSPSFPVSLPTVSVLNKAIVVYPEVVSGNPLKSPRVVRWFLNKPGRLTGKTDYGRNELYFYFQEAFDDPQINPDRGNQLMLVTVLSDVYKIKNSGKRSGTCYILRKGKTRVESPDSLDGTVIDGLSHQEIADIFNKCEYCVSYDLYTMYSYYAAMCGCKSVVVPDDSLTKDQWQPVPELRYGVAYGFQEVEQAEQTVGLMRDYFDRQIQNNHIFVNDFISKCDAFFADDRNGEALDGSAARA